VTFDDLLAQRQPNACAGIFAASVQALKDEEDAFKILGAIPMPLS
jgi:hypothetical protein